MRSVPAKPIFVFATLFIPTVAFAVFATQWLLKWVPLGDYRALSTVALSIVNIVGFNIIVHRIFLAIMPMPEGDYQENSKEDFVYQVYVLYYLLLFNMLLPSLRYPVPLMRLVYIALGAKMGKDSYSAGTMLDPPFITIGKDTIVGFDAVLCPHALEGASLSYGRITLGDNVTIGMKSSIMAGVTIENGGVVAAGAIVTKGTTIKAGEIWGGVPARLLKKPKISVTTAA